MGGRGWGMRQIHFLLSRAEMNEMLDPMAKGEQVELVFGHGSLHLRFVVSASRAESEKALAKLDEDSRV